MHWVVEPRFSENYYISCRSIGGARYGITIADDTAYISKKNWYIIGFLCAPVTTAGYLWRRWKASVISVSDGFWLELIRQRIRNGFWLCLFINSISHRTIHVAFLFEDEFIVTKTELFVRRGLFCEFDQFFTCMPGRWGNIFTDGYVSSLKLRFGMQHRFFHFKIAELHHSTPYFYRNCCAYPISSNTCVRSTACVK